MLKWLIDLDVRKVTAVISVLVFVELGIAQGTVSLTNAIPAAWIPAVLAWAKILAWVGSGITGTHNIAALFSPRDGAPAQAMAAAAVKVLAIFAVLLASLIFVMQPAMAANDGVVLKKPLLTGNIVKDIHTATSGNTTVATTASPANALATLMQQIESVEATTVANVIADIQAADADAGSVVTPANGTTAAVVKDPIAHACYPAMVQFLQSLPTAKPPTGTLVGVQLFQDSRDFIAQIQAGIPTYLKLGCAPLLGDEVNIIVQGLALVGVKVGASALTVAMPGLAPLTLPATLAP